MRFFEMWTNIMQTSKKVIKKQISQYEKWLDKQKQKKIGDFNAYKQSEPNRQESD